MALKFGDLSSFPIFFVGEIAAAINDVTEVKTFGQK